MKLIQNSCDGAYSSIDVRFTKACDNSCSFCIEKDGLDSLGKTDVDALIKGTLDSQIKNVLILGGEPFLQPEKLLQYIIGIANHVDTIYVTTSLPETFITKSNICDLIMDRITGLNVSVQHYDWRVNNILFNAIHNHDRMGVLFKLNQVWANKIRTSINLNSEGINNYDKLLITLYNLQDIGCQHVKINELQHTDQFVSFEEITGYKMKSPFAYGCQTEVKLIGVNMKLTLKRSCFVVEDSLEATFSDLIKGLLRKLIKPKNKFQVIYENGKKENTWLKKEKIC